MAERVGQLRDGVLARIQPKLRCGSPKCPAIARVQTNTPAIPQRGRQPRKLTRLTFRRARETGSTTRATLRACSTRCSPFAGNKSQLVPSAMALEAVGNAGEFVPETGVAIQVHRLDGHGRIACGGWQRPARIAHDAAGAIARAEPLAAA